MIDRASLVLLSLLAGCGASHPASTTTTTTAATTPAVEEEAPAPVAAAPCTTWDPNADPRTPPADVSGPPETARRGASDLRFCIMRDGTGRRPVSSDTVLVHYTGWTTDGQMFDSSHTRGQPVALAVTGVIAGWTQALTHMRIGEVRRLWIPEALAYRGAAGSPAGMLVFDVELVGIQ